MRAGTGNKLSTNGGLTIAHKMFDRISVHEVLSEQSQLFEYIYKHYLATEIQVALTKKGVNQSPFYHCLLLVSSSLSLQHITHENMILHLFIYAWLEPISAVSEYFHI